MNDAIGLIIILSFILIAGIFAIFAIDAFKIHGDDVDCIQNEISCSNSMIDIHSEIMKTISNDTK